MQATSVIDTVVVDMTIIKADHSRSVPIGGIAHAGARGISRVEFCKSMTVRGRRSRYERRYRT